METRFNEAFGAALLGFNREVVVYCRSISDAAAHEYAMDYARMIQNRAKGLQFSLPPIPKGLFMPHRRLIQTTLERLCKKYFQGA
jgi:hypothetical protein